MGAEMNPSRTRREFEGGVALIIAMLLILVLTVLAASIIFVTQSQIWTSINYRLTTQCRYAAEAGVQNTMNWIYYTYTPPSPPSGSFITSTYPVTCTAAPCTGGSATLSAVAAPAANYPDATQQTNFNTTLSNIAIQGLANTTYSTYATLLAMNWPVSWLAVPVQTWKVTSFGNITGVRNAQVQVTAVYQRTTAPIFANALYGTSAACAGAAPSVSVSSGTVTGNIGTNGNLTVGATATVTGSLNVPSTDACAPTLTGPAANVVGGITPLTPGPTYPNPIAPSPLPGTSTMTSGVGDCGPPATVIPAAECSVALPAGHIALIPGQYDNLTISAGTTADLVAGTYNINSLVIQGTLLVKTGPVIINLAGGGTPPIVFDMTGGTLTTGSPAVLPSINLQIIYLGGSQINLTGGPGAAGVVYAPNAPIVFKGVGTQWNGAVIGSTVNDVIGVSIAYDAALQNFPLQPVQYRPISMSWSKF